MAKEEIVQLTELINKKQYLLALKEVDRLKQVTTNEILKLQLKQVEYNINTLLELQNFKL